jgi:signal peptidase II
MKARRMALVAVGIAAFVIVADQIAKHLVVSNINVGERVDVIGPMQFTQTHNEGVAFGIASGGGILVIGLSLVALIALGIYLARGPRSRPVWIASGLILGGAVGNLIDRIRIDYVTDFILFPHWPAFNLADCAITIGVVILAWSLISEAESGAKSEDDPADERTVT